MVDCEKNTKEDIKDWLKKRREDDGASLPKKDAILEIIARNIKNTRPLTGGICSSCGSKAERLVPLPMKLCKGCVKLFMQRSGKMRVLQKPKLEEYYCDRCLGKCWSPLYVNVEFCEKCMTKMGKVHRYGTDEMKVNMRRDMFKKPGVIV